jgi:hypothetical protein
LLHEWTARLGAQLPGVRLSRVRGLALLALGLLRAEAVALPRVAAALPLAARRASTEKRLRRWLGNGGVAPAALWPRLLPGLLADLAGREVVLVFDPTPHRDRCTLLVLGLVRGKRALPVAWRVVPQQAPWPAPMAPLLAAMFAEVAAALPPGAAVTVLADRGLVGPGLVDACRAAGWHLVLRLRAGAGEATKVRLADGAERRLAELAAAVAAPGASWDGAAAVFKEAGWRDGHLTVRWGRGAAEPWVLFSDRPGGAARVREYRRRARAEATYQDLKGRCFGLGRSRLAAPGRVDRLLLALVLALWWADDLGARAVRAGLRRRDDRPGRGARSRLRVGLARLADLLDQGKPPPFPFRPCPDGWLHPWLA